MNRYSDDELLAELTRRWRVRSVFGATDPIEEARHKLALKGFVSEVALELSAWVPESAVHFAAIGRGLQKDITALNEAVAFSTPADCCGHDEDDHNAGGCDYESDEEETCSCRRVTGRPRQRLRGMAQFAMQKVHETFYMSQSNGVVTITTGPGPDNRWYLDD